MDKEFIKSRDKEGSMISEYVDYIVMVLLSLVCAVPFFSIYFGQRDLKRTLKWREK